MDENNGKTIATIAYITVIGFLIAFVMNSTTKSRFATYHLRQAFGIVMMTIVASILRKIAVFGFALAGKLLFIAAFVFLIMGILSALKEEEKPLPVFGPYFQEWFSFIK